MRRESDRFGLPTLLSGLGAKAQIVLIVLFWLGPSAVAAAFFMSMWAGWIPSPVTDNNHILVRVEAKLDSAITSMKTEVVESHDRDESVIKLLWATCRNGAKNPLEEQRCDSYWKR